MNINKFQIIKSILNNLHIDLKDPKALKLTKELNKLNY